MDEFLSNLSNSNINNFFSNNNGCDINRLLVILLLLTGKLSIESITVFPNDFTVTLGTFKIIS
ncbi:MAG: hypothetical protein IKL68_01900 [Clostridia bacterium]|nr:hypothetical protein [Clostridia bacterium]